MMKLNKSLFLLALMATVVFSCKKNDDVPGPKITSTGTKDTIAFGSSITYRPQFSNKNGLSFQWTTNGAPVSTDSVLQFGSNAHGDFHIVLTAKNQTGIDSIVYNLHVNGKYENGFLMVQEGQYGVTNGDLAYYSYDSNKVIQNIYKTENPDKNLGPNTSTLQFASIFNGKVYMVAKVGGPLVVTDAYTMKETGRITALPQDEGHAFVGVDNARGLLSAVDGIYPVNLSTLTLGAKLAGITSAAGDMLLVDKYIFALTQADGVVVLNTTDYSIVKKFPNATMGFTRTKDGAVWAAGDSSLMRIDPVALTLTSMKLPFKVTNPWALWSWKSGSLTTSSNGNDVYIAARNETGGIGGTIEYGGTKLYRYVAGDANSLSAPFITLPAGQYFYGSAVRFNERKNELLIITLPDEWGSSNDNRWLSYNATTGALNSTVRYTGYLFPSLPVFY
ncbi:DUF5074 domain-containing protein [Chitinophaga sp. Hz27]|uniref:DUF5074 domain-containing protein n=1 Tax=Chitinophaga sp. Hz27 TaxID=3347169 RepID=UPI0035E23821